MRLLNVLAVVLIVGGVALAQSPPYGVGRTATTEEIRAWDISISPTGTELPPGHGTAAEGAKLYVTKACAACHGANGYGGRAPTLIVPKGYPTKTGKGPVGTGGPGYTIKCETQKNTHKHVAGTLSMAHAGKDTGGSQFFICHSPQRHLDGVHTVFGQVTNGMDVVNAIKGNDEITSIRVS